MARRNVYFGPRSLTKAVKDVGRPGVHTAKEVCALAVAQLLDFIDGYTVDARTGRRKRFTWKTWLGRTKILYILAAKYGGKACVRQVHAIARALHQGKISKAKARALAKALARKKGVTTLIRRWRI